MVHHFRIWLLAYVCLVVCSSFAYADAPATQPSEDAAYEAAIDKRANDTVKAIKLDDKAKEARVHDLVASQYRNLKKLDDERDAKLKEAGKDKE